MELDEFSFQVVFQKDENDLQIRLDEFSSFIYHLKSLYSFLAENVSVHDPLLDERVISIIRKGEEFRPNTVDLIYGNTVDIIKKGGLDNRYTIYNYYRKDLDDKDIFIESISKESPLIIVFSGVTTVLTLAFIISGGEFELSVVPPRIRIRN